MHFLNYLSSKDMISNTQKPILPRPPMLGSSSTTTSSGPMPQDFETMIDNMNIDQANDLPPGALRDAISRPGAVRDYFLQTINKKVNDRVQGMSDAATAAGDKALSTIGEVAMGFLL